MSFHKLIKKVTDAEDAVEANERRVGADLRQLKSSWASMWTPGRIVIAGLASGFLIGRAEPLGTVARSGGLLRMAGTLTTLVSGFAAAVGSDGSDEPVTTDAVGSAADAESEAARRSKDKLRIQANERVAHDYLERLAAAARQAGGNDAT